MFKSISNIGNDTVTELLKEKLNKESKVSLASAYFTIYAYYELKKELNKTDNFRFIFTAQNDYIEKLNGNDSERIFKANLNQGAIARECAEWIKSKAIFKSMKLPDIMPKSCSIENKNDISLIVGNLDFTSSCIGTRPSQIPVFNNYTSDYSFSKGYLDNFNSIWANETLTEDVTDEVMNSLGRMYKDNTPEFIYYVTLYNLFKDFLDELDEDKIIKSSTGIKDSVVWNMLYKFQKDGVLGAIEKLEKYNGCIIADSVGLGKTFEALAVIRYYELRNDRVLVLCPKKLRDNWLMYKNNDKRNILVKDRFNYDVLNHTDLSRDNGMTGEIDLKTLNWSNYDLLVIDESHNFRNNSARKDRETRYSRLMNDVIKSGVKTKVLLLSATPVNNKMNDLKNQVAFITGGNDDAFEKVGVESISLTLKKAQTIFNKWINLSTEEKRLNNLIEMLNNDYFKLLDTVTIARSRKHIEKYYNIKEMGEFPKRLDPKNIYSDIDLDKQFPKLEEINTIIKKLNLSAYSPLKYLKTEKKEEYSKKYDITVRNSVTFKQTDRENSLIGLMRMNLLKRMESSIHSFGLTVGKIKNQVEDNLKIIEKTQFSFNPDLNITNLDLEEDVVSDLLIGSKIKVLIQDIDHIKWKQDLDEDRERLETLFIETKAITADRDEKLKDLKNIIENKVNNPINDGNKKIIIFTAFADTAEYLYETLSRWLFENLKIHSALVTGSGTNKATLKKIKNDLNSILTNFSPVSKERDKVFPEISEEIDILIATDCISEGQNLQDCDFLINYDIHWNPVRIIQRFGRIDRLGSKNKQVQLINFWPNMELDEYINLEARVSGKMVMLDISATGEENLIEYDGTKQMNDLEYRKNQLKQLKNKVVDLEDISGGISITDLTMNDFRIDLLNYLKINKEILEKTPHGIYSLCDSKVGEGIEENSPGIIFCLKHIKENEKKKDNNSLYPYYMVYVDESGNVKFNFNNTKKILDIYRKLAGENGMLNKRIIDLFNEETNNGENMDEYKELLQKSVSNVIGKEVEQGVLSLFNLGATSIIDDSFDGAEDFEIISYLIVK
ncbi:helicase-related protein [Clostridium sp.]|uniref:helicase-related protein n=1 Tax=Clostridium sp. TaxID=1506 RepID=UPI001A61251F|nr:helicase-related protein [Clostridium sp.]MBK5242622.1 DEAD/DEAH box helicase family protein [Clostridium sp.]